VLNEYCHRSGLTTELSTTEQCNAAVTWYVETRTLTDASGNYTQLLQAFRPTSGCIWFSKRLSGRVFGRSSWPKFQPSSTSGFSQVRARAPLSSNLRTAVYYDTTIKPEAGPPFLPPTTLELRSAWLLGHCLRHLRKSSAGTNMTNCRPEGVFVLLLLLQ
jgi:hypothetical protein